MAKLNTKTSIVDFLKSTKKDSSFDARAKLAVDQGIVSDVSQYVGSADQNISLLNKLQGQEVSSSPTPLSSPKNDTTNIRTSSKPMAAEATTVKWRRLGLWNLTR